MRKLGLVSSFDIKMVTAGMWMIEYCLIVYLKLISKLKIKLLFTQFLK